VVECQNRRIFDLVPTLKASRDLDKWIGRTQAVFPYLPVKFPADATPFFTRTNIFFDDLLFFRPRQFRI
jgi:hypothetical protein